MVLPERLYHWTEAFNVESIKSDGLHTSLGGYLNQHEKDPGVNLTTCPSVEEWNSDIFYLARPVRIEIDTSQLDVARLGADLNSLFDENCMADMQDEDLDAEARRDQTWQNSLRFTGNIRYRRAIPPSALVGFEAFVAPRDWKMGSHELEMYGSESARPGSLADESLPAV
jgi:hypothetical protein